MLYIATCMSHQYHQWNSNVLKRPLWHAVTAFHVTVNQQHSQTSYIHSGKIHFAIFTWGFSWNFQHQAAPALDLPTCTSAGTAKTMEAQGITVACWSWGPIVPSSHMLPLFHHCGSLEISPISCSLRNLCLNFSWRKAGRPESQKFSDDMKIFFREFKRTTRLPPYIAMSKGAQSVL